MEELAVQPYTELRDERRESEYHDIAQQNQNQNTRALLIQLCRGSMLFLMIGSVFFYVVATPVEFAFWVKPPSGLLICSIAASLVIVGNTLVKLVQQCFTGFFTGKSILLLLDFFSCLPYGMIADKTVPILIGVIWLRMLQFRRILKWQKKLDEYLKRTRHIYWLLVLRILKIVALDLLWVHIAAAVLYYTATSQRKPENSWLGSITTLGDIDFKNFKSLPFWTRYTVSVYFSYITVSTVGYGDIHPQTLVELWVIHGIVICTTTLAVLSSFMGGFLIEDFIKQRKKGRQEAENKLVEEVQRLQEEENKRLEEGRRRVEEQHRRHLEERSRLMEIELN